MPTISAAPRGLQGAPRSRWAGGAVTALRAPRSASEIPAWIRPVQRTHFDGVAPNTAAIHKIPKPVLLFLLENIFSCNSYKCAAVKNNRVSCKP